MATYTAVGGIRATYTFRDAKGSTTNASVMLPASVTLAQAKAFCDDMGDAMIAASDAQLMSYNINQQSTASGAAAPVAGSRVEDKGLISIRTAAGKDVQVTIPAIKLATLTTTEKDLDLTDPLITAISTLLITGDGAIAPVDSNASDLAQVIFGRLQQRKGLSG